MALASGLIGKKKKKKKNTTLIKIDHCDNN
jgi:hypothetical protein